MRLIDADALQAKCERNHLNFVPIEFLINAPTIAASPWHRVKDELPKENNCYIVYLRQGTEMKTPEWMGGEPLSYVTEMGFDKEQMLWKDGDEAYNAVLSAVDTKKDFHVTHWTEKPEPPQEDE